MGAAIRSDMYVDTPKGRVYTCCQPCLEKVKGDWGLALQLLNKRGERLMTTAEYQQRMQHTPVFYKAVLHDVLAKKYYEVKEFKSPVFKQEITVDKEVDDRSCLCGADYFLYVYSSGKLQETYVIFESLDYTIQYISDKRSGDQSLAKASRSFLKSWLGRSKKERREIEGFLPPPAAALDI